jgi:hypothetical protein
VRVYIMGSSGRKILMRCERGDGFMAMVALFKAGIACDSHPFDTFWVQKIDSADMTRAVAVLRFAGYEMIADEKEIERTK